MRSFAARQKSLRQLDDSLNQRAAELASMLEQAETVGCAPHFLRKLIIFGRKKGRNPAQMAKATGLSLGEMERILAQEHS